MMVTEKDDLAFPIDTNSGLTKREYFAAKAMQGLLSDASIQLEYAAHHAVVLADLLIRELNGEDVKPVTKYVPFHDDIPE